MARLYPQSVFGPNGVTIPAVPQFHDEFLGLCAMVEDMVVADPADVDEFMRFVATSGGFSIW